MIIQTSPEGQHRLAIIMHEHTALSGQFSRAFALRLPLEAVRPTKPCDGSASPNTRPTKRRGYRAR